MKKTLVVIALLVSLLQMKAQAMDLVATVAISGRAQSVLLYGNYLYSADQFGLWVLDINQPQQVASLSHWGSPGLSTDFLLQGTIGYLCDGTSGLQVLDLSDPALPAFLQKVNALTTALHAEKNGNHLFIASGDDGLQILDISSPDAPAAAGEYRTQTWVSDLAVNEANQIALTDADSVYVLDAADPANVVLQSKIACPGGAQKLVLTQNLLFILSRGMGISIWDLTAPTLPDSLISFGTGGWSTDMIVQEDTLLVADWLSGVSVYEAVDPSRPNLLGSFQPAGFPQALDVQGDLLALAAGDAGIELWDVSDMSNAQPLGADMPAGSPQDASFLPDGLIYEAAGDAGLRIWDAELSISEPLAQVQTSGWANSLAQSENWVYLADGFGGVRIFDKSSNPVEAFSLPTAGYAGPLQLGGDNTVFVAQGDVGFSSFILEGYLLPQENGLTETENPIYDLSVGSGLLIACEGIPGFEIFDIADPASPQMLSARQPEGGAWCAFQFGNTAYIGVGAQGLSVYDLTSPETPVEVGSISDVGWVQSLCGDALGNLIACSGMDGIFALALDQALPQVYDHYDTPGLALHADLAGQTLICADQMDLSLFGISTGVVEPIAIPDNFLLLQSYPNPFNPSTTIVFSLPFSVPVELLIFDLAGRRVADLQAGRMTAGKHAFTWSPAEEIASGTYLISLKAGQQRSVKPLIYLK